MTRDQIIDFVQQTQALLQELGNMQQNINQGKALRELLEAQGEQERALKMAHDIQRAQQLYERSSQALLRKCKRDTLEACETLQKDIVERLKLADSAFDAWRSLMANHDLLCTLGQTLPEDRAVREKDISEAQARFETALKVASDVVPAPGVVLL